MTMMKATALGMYSSSIFFNYIESPIPGVSTMVTFPFCSQHESLNFRLIKNIYLKDNHLIANSYLLIFLMTMLINFHIYFYLYFGEWHHYIYEINSVVSCVFTFKIFQHLVQLFNTVYKLFRRF